MRNLEVHEAMLKAQINESNADRLFPIINRLRRARFGVRCYECEDCGFVFPADDITSVRKSDGKVYPICLSCSAFGRMIRAVFGRAA